MHARFEMALLRMYLPRLMSYNVPCVLQCLSNHLTVIHQPLQVVRDQRAAGSPAPDGGRQTLKPQPYTLFDPNYTVAIATRAFDMRICMSYVLPEPHLIEGASLTLSNPET